MPKSCCVAFCTSNKAKNPELKFIRLPNKHTEPVRRTKWLQAIRRHDKCGRLWNPVTPHVYVCSLHFVSGLKHEDETHPDYIPSVFPNRGTSQTSAATKVERWNRRRKHEHVFVSQSARQSINEHMMSVGEEILCVLEKRQRGAVCSVKLNVRVFVLERLSAAAEFMCNLFQREMETLETLLEEQKKLRFCDAILQPNIKIHRAEVSSEHEERNPSLVQEEPRPPQIKEEQEEEALTLLYNKTWCNTLSGVQHLPVCREEVSPEKERSASLAQEEPGPPYIKEEQEELLIRPEEINRPGLTLLSVKSEKDDAENTLASSSTDTVCGASLPTSDDQHLSSDCSESDITDDSDEWETNVDQSPLNTLKSHKTQHVVDEEYMDGWRKKRKRCVRTTHLRWSQYVGKSVDDITKEDLDNICYRAKDKLWDRDNGTSCHQCRQKTLDTKTVCRSGVCRGGKGQFCGPCLKNRYGEDVGTALLDPTWSCPICRGVCNCSICRKKEGRCATGTLVGQARYNGHDNVQEYLERIQKDLSLTEQDEGDGAECFVVLV